MSYPCLVGSADFQATDRVAREVETSLQQEVGSLLGASSRSVVGVIQPRPLECFDEDRMNAARWFDGVVLKSDRPLASESKPEKQSIPPRLPVLTETEEIQLRRIMISHDLSCEERADALATAVCQKVKEILKSHPSVCVTQGPHVRVYDPFRDADPERFKPEAPCSK